MIALIVGMDLTTPISQLIVMPERNYIVVQTAKQVFQDKQIIHVLTMCHVTKLTKCIAVFVVRYTSFHALKSPHQLYDNLEVYSYWLGIA